MAKNCLHLFWMDDVLWGEGETKQNKQNKTNQNKTKQ